MAWQEGNFQLLLIEAGTGFSGLFAYSPEPGPGNLFASIAASAGTDPYGNAYPAGISSLQGQLSGQQIFGSVFQGTNFRIDEHGIFLYEIPVGPPPPPPPPPPTQVPYVIGGNAVNAGTSTVVIGTPGPALVPTTAGDVIFVSADAAAGTSTVTGVTDTKGNTYSALVADSTQIPTASWTSPGTNALGAGDAITVTYSGTAGAKCVSVAGLPNLPATPLDQATSTSGLSAAPSLSTSNPLAEAGEVGIATLGSANSGGVPAWAAGWTPLDRRQLGSGQYLSVAYTMTSNPAGATASATLPTSAKWGLLLAMYKEI